MGFFRRRIQPPPPPGLADEAEAFLSGRAADLFAASGCPVPAWARLNVVAHGRFEDLARLAAEYASRAEDHDPQDWDTCVGLIAAELMRVAGGGPQRARTLQLRALMPLEARLLGDEGADISPARLDVLVRAVLRQHPSGHPA